MFKLIKKINENGLVFTLEGVINPQGKQVGMIINKWDEGERRYLSQPRDLQEANEHLEFYKKVYKVN